jgi:signal transduction histidine kinase
MLAILSLPALAFLSYYAKNGPAAIAVFRLRLAFGAVFCLGALLFWKLNLLSRRLAHLVSLTTASIANLRNVQERVSHTQKLTALGRLAAGAAHEISNPLTAILGYSELLADIPILSPQDRESAQAIQKHVHRAQSAVNSLRSTLRSNSSAHPIVIGKPTDS